MAAICWRAFESLTGPHSCRIKGANGVGRVLQQWFRAGMSYVKRSCSLESGFAQSNLDIFRWLWNAMDMHSELVRITSLPCRIVDKISVRNRWGRKFGDALHLFPGPTAWALSSAFGSGWDGWAGEGLNIPGSMLGIGCGCRWVIHSSTLFGVPETSWDSKKLVSNLPREIWSYKAPRKSKHIP